MTQAKQLNIKIMKTQKELQDKLTKMELRLESLYTRQDDLVSSSTINDSIIRYEARIAILKWAIGQDEEL